MGGLSLRGPLSYQNSRAFILHTTMNMHGYEILSRFRRFPRCIQSFLFQIARIAKQRTFTLNFHIYSYISKFNLGSVSIKLLSIVKQCIYVWLKGRKCVCRWLLSSSSTLINLVSSTILPPSTIFPLCALVKSNLESVEVLWWRKTLILQYFIVC